MKGKIGIYYNAPEISKVRSRVKPTEEFTKKMRTAIANVIAEVVNENVYSIRAKMIREFANMGETAKEKRYLADLCNPLKSFFDCKVSLKPFSADETEEESEETTEETTAEPETEGVEEFED